MRVIWSVALLLWLAAGGHAAAQEPASPSGGAAEEVPLLLLHRPYVSTFMLALQRNGEFYLPLLEVLTRLQVPYRFDPASGRMVASRGEESGSYIIDVRAMIVVKADLASPLVSDDVIPSDLEIYVRGSVLEQLFGWTVRPDATTMSVEIRSRSELPVTVAARGQQNARSMWDRGPVADAPLAFPRQRRVVDGATLEYQLRASGSMAHAGLRTGFELLGGDFEVRMRAAYDSVGSFDPQEVRWRYVTGGSLLSQLTLGRVYTTGLRPRALDGVEITNRTLDLRRVAGTHLVEGEAAPGTEVEILVNDRPVDEIVVDGSGRYRVEVPLPYGSTLIRLRTRGPAGDVLEDETAVQVPFTFLPVGVADYSVGIGRSATDGTDLALGSISIGLARWLTARAGAEYAPRDSANRLQPWAGASLRLARKYHLSAEAAPALHYRTALEARFGMRHAFMATVTAFDTDRGGAKREATARAHTQWALMGQPLHVRMQTLVRERRTGGMAHASDVELATVLGRFRPGFGWRHAAATGRSGSTVPASSHFRAFAHAATPSHRRVPALLRSWLVRGSASYDAAGRSVADYELGLTRLSSSGHAFEAVYRRAASANGGALELRVRADLQPMRTSVTARRGAAGDWTTEFTGTGAVALDVPGRELQFTSRPGSELAGAAIRAFIDSNGNGRRDPGEPPVASRVRLDRASHVQRRADGTLYASSLAPYRRYTAEFDAGSIDHPMLGSRLMAFAFIADPNRTKRIDVPFFMAGAIDGSIRRRTAGGDRAVPGLRVHVRSADDRYSVVVPVFADGTFHHAGLPPGSYSAVLDPDQLGFLGVVAAPCRREFTIEATSDGHFLADLDFVLVPATPENAKECAGDA